MDKSIDGLQMTECLIFFFSSLWLAKFVQPIRCLVMQITWIFRLAFYSFLQISLLLFLQISLLLFLQISLLLFLQISLLLFLKISILLFLQISLLLFLQNSLLLFLQMVRIISHNWSIAKTWDTPIPNSSCWKWSGWTSFLQRSLTSWYSSCLRMIRIVQISWPVVRSSIFFAGRFVY